MATGVICIGPGLDRDKFKPEELKDNQIWIDLTDTESFMNYILNDENLFEEPHELKNYVRLVFTNPISPFEGEYSIESEHLRSLTIDFKQGSAVTLRLDCPNLFALNIENCDNLIMSESTRPRRLELINVDGEINVPENIQHGKEWELFGKCEKYRKDYWGDKFYVAEFSMKIMERFYWQRKVELGHVERSS